MDPHSNIPVINGDASACAPPVHGEQFAVAFFIPGQPTSIVSTHHLRPYNFARPRQFGVAKIDWRDAGVCIMSSPTNRLDCGVITFDAEGQPALDRVQLSDPRVQGTVEFVPLSGGVPNCGTCF